MVCEKRKYVIKSVDLFGILDELAVCFCVSPKVKCYEIRTPITFTVQFSGSLTERRATYEHTPISSDSRTRTLNVQKVQFWGYKLFEPYIENRYARQALETGSKSLVESKLSKLKRMVNDTLHLTLVNTEPCNFIHVRCFLLSTVAMAGYVRRPTFRSAPRSAAPRDEDVHDIPSSIRNTVIDLDRQAKEANFFRPDGEKLIPGGVGSRKSTSASVSPISAEVVINGKPTKAKVHKKTGVGALLGKRAFRKKSTLDTSAAGRYRIKLCVPFLKLGAEGKTNYNEAYLTLLFIVLSIGTIMFDRLQSGNTECLHFLTLVAGDNNLVQASATWGDFVSFG